MARIQESSADKQRSPLTLSRTEIATAILASIATWFGLRHVLLGTLPYPCGTSVNDVPISCGWTYETAWADRGYPLFSAFVVPAMVVLAVSSIFFVRAIRKDIRHFSSLGHVALAWPLIAFPLMNLLSTFSLYCLPIGLGLAVLAAIRALAAKRHWGDVIALPISFAFTWLGGVYFGQWWNAYGD